MFMTGKLAQCPKAFEMKTDGGNVQFRPVKTGHGDKFAPKDLLILRSEQGHFTLAYTPFCPLHATNVHSAAQCKQWQKKLQLQKDAKAQGRGLWGACEGDPQGSEVQDAANGGCDPRGIRRVRTGRRESFAPRRCGAARKPSRS